MIGFTIVLITGMASVVFWRRKKLDHFWTYAVWVAVVVTLAYFVFSPQGIGDIIK